MQISKILNFGLILNSLLKNFVVEKLSTSEADWPITSRMLLRLRCFYEFELFLERESSIRASLNKKIWSVKLHLESLTLRVRNIPTLLLYTKTERKTERGNFLKKWQN